MLIQEATDLDQLPPQAQRPKQNYSNGNHTQQESAAVKQTAARRELEEKLREVLTQNWGQQTCGGWEGVRSITTKGETKTHTSREMWEKGSF